MNAQLKVNLTILIIIQCILQTTEQQNSNLIIWTKQNNMLTSLLQHYKSFLLKQKCPTSLLFFSCYALLHFYHEQQLLWLVHVLAIFLLLWRNYNMLYMLPTFIYVENDVLSFLFGLSSVLSCDKKWKMYIFLFMVGDSYLFSSSFNSYYIAAGCLGMCIAIYRSLMFQTNVDNEDYFKGFAVIFTINTAQLITWTLQIQLHFALLLNIALVSFVLAKMVFQIRIDQIRSFELQKLRDLSIMPIYIDQLIEDFKVPEKMKAKLQVHQINCIDVNCFCKNEEYRHQGEYYLQQMFEKLMKRLGSLRDDQLWSYYIDFYLKKDQVFTAYYYLLKWRPSSYFSMISKWRSEAKIAKFLQKKDFLNPFVKEYKYGLQYDDKCLFVSTEIHQILKLKIDFWKEVGKEYLNMHKLQTVGRKIVRKMYDLNNFYNYVIKEHEKYLYCFDCTVLYGMYLISATNFKDYAKSIIKNTSKQMEEACITEMNASQTFAIRAVIKNKTESYMKQQSMYFQAEKEITSELKLHQSHQNNFKLIIDAVSVGFCRLLNISKQEMVGSQLHTLIPNCYKEVHNERISQILDFKSENIKYVSPPKVLHAELKLMFKGAHQQLFSGFICIKYHMDIKEGVTFISVIKKTAEKRVMALATFDGVLMEKERGFPSEIMRHKEVKKCIAEIREIWQRDRTIKQQCFSLMMNRTNYEISIDAPFAFLLLDKDSLKDKVPPLHIQLLNQDTNLRKTTGSDKANKQADCDIRRMQLMMNEDQQSSVSRMKGANSVVNVISNFCQNNVVPIYRSIIFAFLLIIVCNFVLNLSFNLLNPLSWNNISPSENAIVANARQLMIPIVHSRAALNLQDFNYYKRYSDVMNDTRLASFYSGQSYKDEIAEMFHKMNLQLGFNVQKLFREAPDLVWPAIRQKFQTSLIVPNVQNHTISSQVPTQILTYLEVILLYALDINFISQQALQDSAIMPFIYREVESQTSDYPLVLSIISSSFGSSNTKQMAIGIALIGLAVLLVIPMIIMLHKRLNIHERVFDLLSSIDGMQVKREIESLFYISNILNNYDESREQLKTNVMEYQFNTRIPVREQERNRKTSVINQLVMGLQKFDVASIAASNNLISSEVSLVKKIKYSPYQKDEMVEIFSSIKNDIFMQMNNNAQFHPRKRTGELELTGSELDKGRKAIPKHCLLYILLMSFVPFLLYTMLSNLSGISAAERVHANVYNCYRSLIKYNNRLYSIKFYLWQGGPNFKTTNNITHQLPTLKILLSKLMSYQTYTNNEKNPFWSSNNTKLSEYQTSLRIIEGELVTTVKSLVEERYKFQNSWNSNQTWSYSDLPPTLYQNIIYLQMLNNQKEAIIKNMMGEVLEDMYGRQVGAKNNKKLLLGVLFLWSVCCFVVGLLVTLDMKKQFFEEVYILTFLNEQMLASNKRVESYIENISKNSYQ